MTTVLGCPACGEPVATDDDFCESCGARISVATPEPGGCPACGAPPEQADADGYCSRCGHRMGRPSDHGEVEAGEAGGLAMAAVTDRGLRHHRNEDAMALRGGPGFSVLVVCDGVSTTAHPDQASAAAARAFADALASSLAGDPTVAGAAAGVAAAATVAQEAVLEVSREEPGGYPQSPSSTLVAVAVTREGLLTANIGDSRAYWIDPTGTSSRVLSRDDSMAEANIAAGMAPDDAYAAPDAHMITRWLGADAPEPAPNTGVMVPPGPGLLVVCSDGLWNYYESPQSLRSLVREGPPGEALLALARRLVEAALDAGGHDNITVALARFGGPAPPGLDAGPAESETERAPETPAETKE